MQRRGGSGQAAKRQRKARKSRIEPALASQSPEQFEQLKRERDEALERETASSDILRIISNSPTDLQSALGVIAESAARLLDVAGAEISRAEGDGLRLMAKHGPLPQRPVGSIRPINRGWVMGRAVIDRTTVQVPDLQAAASEFPEGAASARQYGHRTTLATPLLREGTAIGAILIRRMEVRPFTDKQIALLQNFAAQAVIAIENARLLTELRQRTADLSEALEQRTATSDVLQVIASSSGELEPVFRAMLANATRICEAAFGSMLLMEGDTFRRVAIHNPPPRFAEFHRQTPVIKPQQDLKLLIETKGPVHIADAAALNPDSPIVKYGGAQTLLIVPLLKDDALVGAIAIYRQEVRPFTDKQIELLTNFAAQAVIAIENARLLNELRESLQQQTATADVLKVISRSTFDLNAVLHALIQTATQLCDADHGNISRERDGVYQRVATYGYTDDFTKHLMNLPVIPDRGTATGRSLLEGKVVHVHDVRADPEYTFVEAQKRGDFRTVVSVPMLRERTTIGILALTRREVRPFTDKQIELVRTFADQAAIAIENVRLFESVEARTRELAKSLEELRTTQDRLVQTQKLALLGQLTAGIAHEIKNPLNFVNNFSGISAELIDELQGTVKGISLDDKARTEINELTDTLKNNFDKVVHHGRRADAIVKNMLQHSREGSGEHRVIDINALVEESLNLAWHGARAETQGFEIKLKQSFDPSAGGADVFPQDIRRALLNVIANGFHAATRRRAETNSGGYEPTLTASTKNLGDRVEIRVRDNGTGITADVKEKMFEPFFTTKPTGEGTGLGLSISHDIVVKQHAGSIEVDTQLDEFTEIRIILPRTAVFV
jgi:two-component system, NtrC family, sensor kinase